MDRVVFVVIERGGQHIRDWIKTWNDNPRPYVWVKTADQILAALARYCERVSASASHADES